MAGIGKKIKGAATNAAKGKSTGGSGRGMDKAKNAVKNRLKYKRMLSGRGPTGSRPFRRSP